MRVWTAARHHKWIMLIGVLAGALFALAWTYQVSWANGGLDFVLRSPGTYVIKIDAVIDTTEFGIGRSDTDMYKLSLMAPTYAQLVTSEPVLRRAESILGRPIDADLTAEAPASVPMVRLTVEGEDPTLLAPIASAVLEAMREYVSDNQSIYSVPAEFRLTVRGMGQPSEPELVSNRRTEIAIILFLLPIAIALTVAYRQEFS